MTPNFALIDAIKRDNERDFKAAIAAGASLAARDLYGRSALEVAEDYASANTGRELLLLGADPNQISGIQQRRLLHRTAIKGNFSFTGMLIAKGADVNAEDVNGKRPLHLAAAGGNQFVCLDLIKAGAEINAQTNSGKTALFFAARRGDSGMIKMLLANDADASIADNRGISPAMEAARAGNIEAAKVLIKSSTYGMHSEKVDVQKVLKVAESAGRADVIQAIHEEFRIPVQTKNPTANRAN